MEKELIIITSYCNTKEKKDVLLHFLKSLQNFRNEFSVLLTSHIPLDSFYYDYIDYFYYDKNNLILNSPSYNYNSWFGPKDNYIINSSYVELGNTHATILSMLIPSIKVAEGLGYKKLHYFEYDSYVHKIDELKDNSRILNDYDFVVYGTKNNHLMNGSIYSFRTDRVIDLYKKYDIEQIKSLYKNKPTIPENITFDLINTQRKCVVKNYEDLNKNGIEVSKVRGNKFYWDVPYYDTETGELLFISHNNNNEETHDVKIIVNEDKIFNIKGLIPSEWRIIKLLDNFYDVQSLIVLRNNNKILDLKFDDETRDEFMRYNKSTGKLE